MVDIKTQMLEVLRTNNRINIFLVDNVSDEGLDCTLSKRGGRNVRRQFAHLNNVRVWQLEKRAKDLAEGLYIFETHEEPEKEKLKSCLIASQERLEHFFEQFDEEQVKRRYFKKGILTNLAYFVSHESHHRGNILLTLKESGYKMDQKIKYAIWDWDRI